MAKTQKKVYASSNEVVPEFFKVYLPLNSERLRIPPAFVKHFNGEIPKKAILRSRIGRSWCVAVKNDKKYLFFQTGWQSFVKDYPLNIGDFLIFSYCGNLEFYVKVFSTTGLEKEEALACSTPKKTPTTSLKEKQLGTQDCLRNPKDDGRKELECAHHQPNSSIPVELDKEIASKGAKSVDPENSHFTASVIPSSPYILQEAKNQEVPDHGHHPQCESTLVEMPTMEDIRPLKSVKWEDASSYRVDMEEDKKEGPVANSPEEYQNFELLSNTERRCKGKKIEGKITKTSGKKPILRELENLDWGIRTKGTKSTRRDLKKWGWNGTWRTSNS